MLVSLIHSTCSISYSASSECQPNKVLAVNACTLAGRFSLNPQEQCDLKYPEGASTYNGGKHADGDLNATDPYTLCICQGETIVSQCWAQICPQDEIAVEWASRKNQSCTNITLPGAPQNTYNPIGNTRNVPSFAYERLSMTTWSSRLTQLICASILAVFIAGVL
jgi:hypothetical protein